MGSLLQASPPGVRFESGYVVEPLISEVKRPRGDCEDSFRNGDCFVLDSKGSLVVVSSVKLLDPSGREGRAAS